MRWCLLELEVTRVERPREAANLILRKVTLRPRRMQNILANVETGEEPVSGSAACGSSLRNLDEPATWR